MLTRRTLFVVGAGASCDFDFPIGSKLVTDITKDVALERGRDAYGDETTVLNREMRSLASRLPRNIDLMKACRALGDALPSLATSIDTYLDDQRDDPDLQFVGKLAVVRRILQYERSSCLHSNDYQLPSDQFDHSKSSWLRALFEILRVGCPRPLVARFFENVSMIVFNYDRCIEAYFTQALQKYYRLDFGEAAGIVRKANIFHVYGSLGQIPVRESSHSAKEIRFGDTAVFLPELVPGISTYAESCRDRAIKQRVWELEKDAQLVVFLGFGYLKENLDLIRDEPREAPVHVIGTAKDVPSFNFGRIRDTLSRRFAGGFEEFVHLDNSNCATLLKSYSQIFE